MAALLKKRALAEYSQVIQEQPKPLKKLRLAKKIIPGSSAAAYVGLLEKSKTSNDALQILLRISDSQKFQERDLPDTIKKLAEHFQREQESVVRAKVLSLLGDIGKESGADVQVIIEEVMQAMKNEESHKVISQGISSLLKLGKLLPDNVTIHHKLVSFIKQYLSDTSHSVKCKCLELMGELVSISSDAATTQPLLRLVGDYTHCEEARVRSAAFNTMLRLHERGLKLDPSVYSEVCLALKDDYEIVRQVALRIVWVLGQTYSENLVTLPDSDEEIRLVDDAFGKICHMINDLSMRVRTQAARLLGSMTSVSPRFLQQTLDKKLMSNMRRKRSAHERAWESITSGEWASGRNWADDAPRELVDAESVSLVNSGSCGAFVHGLEDEYQEVRNASVESLCSLAMNNPQFALMSLDFLVDMFNDEIEEVRLKAIDSLTKISRHIILREDQLETILGALKDFSIDVREGLHKMLASCRLSSKGCLQMCVEALLENLKKYPVDRKSTWCCLQKVGQQHPELTLILVPELLAIHPFFDMPEPDVEDPAYVSILILVLNAAQHCPTMLQLFEEHTVKHYCYLRDTMPHLVPALKVGGSSGIREVVADEEANATAVRFLEAMVSRLEAARRGPARVRAELLAAAQRDLARLAEVGGAAGDAARMSALHVNCQVLLARVLESRLWASPGALASQQGAAVRTNITQLLHDCLRLQYLFIGVSEDDMALVKQLKLKALALQLVYIVRCSNSSALALCDHFLEQVEDVHRYLGERGISPEAFTASLVKEMSQLEETKPGPVARCLLPLLQNAPPVPQLRPTTSVQMTTATLACEPGGDADAPLKFTAGLVLGVPLEAELRNLQSPELLRIKVWSEACALHIGLALDLAAVEGGTAATTAARRARAPADADPCLLDLCKPVKVYVSPKPVKRGI